MIKSEKARQFIYSKVRKGSDCPGYDVVQAGEIETAIELSEYDARERAIEARIKSCPYLYPDGRCAGSLISCIKQDCPQIEEFLKNYDNN